MAARTWPARSVSSTARNGYEVASNDLCGNFSAEYGGAISHFGLSNNGSIHDNRIYFNHSYDEGAGIMIAGELPLIRPRTMAQPDGPQGSGAVNIYNNLIQANLSDDDGGGLRFLMAGNFPMNVYNNMIVNNISTHEGGGVALDDAPNVRFYQQHGHEEQHHRHGDHQQWSACSGRSFDRAEQHSAAGHPAWRFAALQQPVALQQHLLG